jgi:DNA-binding Lrp family transcriptional regulator
MSDHLDRTDRAILDLLQRDGLASFKEIAHTVGLAPSTVHDRVRRLRALGALRGVHAEVDPKVLGVNLQAMLLIELSLHRPETYALFRDHLTALPEILAWYEVAGRLDLLVHVGVYDTAHLQRLVLDAFTARPEVRRVETTLIFDWSRAAALPNLTREA